MGSSCSCCWICLRMGQAGQFNLAAENPWKGFTAAQLRTTVLSR